MNLLFDKKKIEYLKSCKDANVTCMIREILKKADNALNVKEIDESYADDSEHLVGKQAQHGNYYEASKPFYEYMPILGFAYHFTGDSRYFEKAKKLMLLYSGYKKWYGSGFFAKSELNNAHFNFGMACGYDMFYDSLTKEERKIISDATIQKGIMPTVDDWLRPETRVHAMDTMGHNWWIVCISMAGVAALVMKKDCPELEKEYGLILDGVKTWFDYNGNEYNMKPKTLDNGAYYEGLSYLDFAMREYGIFRLAVKRLENKDIFDDEYILKMCSEFYCNAIYPSEKEPKTVRFGDMATENMLAAPKILLASGAELPYMRWYISKWHEREATIYDILFYDEIYNGTVQKPSCEFACYNKIGWSIMRNSFSDNSSMLAIKCGDTWNHAHADAASFIYYSDGEEIISEGGTCAYGEKEYVDYFCSSLAHNTILYENHGQERRDIFNHTRLKGKLFGEYSDENIKYICADATGPMAHYYRRFLRHFLMVDDMVMIYDDLEAYESGKIQFLLHEKKSGYFKMLTECEKSIRKGFKNYNINETEDYFSYEQSTDAEGKAKFVSMIGKKSCDYAISDSDDMYKVFGGDWTFYINKLSDGSVMHKNCINKAEDYETDAILLAIGKDGIFFVNASFVRCNGKALFDSKIRKTGFINKKKKTAEV